MIKKQLLGAAIITTLLSIAGCNTTPDPLQQQNITLLQSHSWELRQIGATDIDLSKKGSIPNLQFHPSNQNFYGTDGCNRLTGIYQVKEQQIIMQNVAGTRMICSDNMQQVDQFNQAFNKVTAYQVYGSTLRLLDRFGNVVLLFHAVK